ncbi:MAG TPA: xanthine dehydrogenase family protein molybdopterin-binding subunit [Steroidobacteraceae bacterium]
MSIGAAIDRLDGIEKVTGRARYTADTPMQGVVYAVMVCSTRAHARIARIDVDAAEAAPGVLRVFTHLSTPKFGEVSGLPLGQDFLPLQSDQVLYEGQPIALVVARTLETAMAAARKVKAVYREQPFETDFSTRLDQGEARPFFFWEPDSHVGDVAAAWQSAEAAVKQTYRTADRHHCTMEPSATLAVWQGGKLTLFDSVQGVVDARNVIAKALRLEPNQVRVKNDFVGGGFGCKGWVWPHQLLAAMAAREIGKPVKLVLTRAQTFTSHGYQPATIQTLAISAQKDGTLIGIRHDSFLAGSYAGNHVEGTGIGTRSLYACPSISTTHRLVRVHRAEPTPMRAPIEGIGLVATEIAMDELAYELKMDPLALRLKNYADRDPTDGKPFSSKKLRECYEQGAGQFGWSRRSFEPRSMRDGRDLIGYGMATALFAAFRQPSRARVSIDAQGVVRVETSTQEIGTGARTVISQIAAETLGVPVDRVHLAWGDTDLPPAPMTAGSVTTGSAGSAVHDGALKLRKRLEAAGAKSAADYANVVRNSNGERLTADGEFNPPAESSKSLFSFGAVFAEVRVDERIPIPRVSRIVGVYDAGRIINPKTARSQMIGGLTWGIGQALLEHSAMDHRLGRFLSKNLAGYLVPVNADVAQIDVSFIEEADTEVNLVGARGIGELGAIGVGAAIANAVFHATGVRVRELPIRPEMLM